MNEKTKLLLITTIQIMAVSYIALTGPVIAQGIYLFVELIGIMLYIWSASLLGSTMFAILPKGSTLITSGPFAYIRHPMYFGAICIMSALSFHTPTPIRLGMLVCFIVLTFLRIELEESRLKKHFPTYKEYIKGTKKILLFIY